MDNKEYIEQMKNIQMNLLSFLDLETDYEEYYQVLISILEDSKIQDNKNDLETFIKLVINIANDHHRSPNFFVKIEQVLLHFKGQITQNYTNFEIFLLFQRNKRLLLFLLQEKMMFIDQQISKIMKERNFKQMYYDRYFQTELKPFFQEEEEVDIDISVDENNDEEEEEEEEEDEEIEKEKENKEEKLPDDFDEKRKIGENDSFICKLIRNDSIDVFISHVNQHSISVNSYVSNSIYETNHMLLSSRSSLIEYSAFFGSVKIFKYLQLNGAILNSSIWLYAIHGNEPEIIHILEKVGGALKKYSNYSEEFDDLSGLDDNEDDDKTNKKIKKNIDSNDDDYEEEEEYDSEESESYFFADSSDVEFGDYDPLSVNDLTYKQCLKEAIKCHHNDIANYIICNYMTDKIIQYNNDNSYHRGVNAYSFFYSNFVFFPKNLDQKFIIFYACRYDYYTIVKNLLKNTKIKLQLRTNVFFIDYI